MNRTDSDKLKNPKKYYPTSPGLGSYLRSLSDIRWWSYLLEKRNTEKNIKVGLYVRFWIAFQGYWTDFNNVWCFLKFVSWIFNFHTFVRQPWSSWDNPDPCETTQIGENQMIDQLGYGGSQGSGLSHGDQGCLTKVRKLKIHDTNFKKHQTLLKSVQ